MEAGQDIQVGPNAVNPADLLALNNALEPAQILLPNLKGQIVWEVLRKHNPATVLIVQVSNIYVEYVVIVPVLRCTLIIQYM